MTKLISFLILSGLLLIGCQDQSDLVGPDNQNLQQTAFEKGDGNTLNPIKLKITKKLRINGDKGGKVKFKYTYSNNVDLEASLDIPSGAYSGYLTFCIEFDAENYDVKLYPTPFTFDIPVQLSLQYKNINMEEIDPETFDFVHFPVNGGSEPIEHDGVKFGDSTIKVSNARLPHFSRFGFVKRGGEF
jgi:hypothetical protein